MLSEHRLFPIHTRNHSGHNIFTEDRPEQNSSSTLFMKGIIHEQIKMDVKLPCLDPFESRCSWFTRTRDIQRFRFKNRFSLISSLTILISSPVRSSVMWWWNGSQADRIHVPSFCQNIAWKWKNCNGPNCWIKAFNSTVHDVILDEGLRVFRALFEGFYAPEEGERSWQKLL